MTKDFRFVSSKDVNHASSPLRNQVCYNLLHGRITSTQQKCCDGDICFSSFFEWEADQTEYVKIKILSLRNDIASKVFWDEVGDAYHTMMPIIFALRQLDSRAPNIGKVYMA